MATLEADAVGRPASWVTREEVRDTIFKIMGEGSYPSEAKIRSALAGRGSPATVLRFAREVYVELGTKGLDIDAPDVPAPLLEAAKILWRDARAIAEADYQKARAEHDEQIAAFTETVARESERATAAEEQVNVMGAEIERLQNMLIDAGGARMRSVRLMAAARKRAKASAANLRGLLERAQREYAESTRSLTAAHTAAIEKLDARAALQLERHEAAERLSAQKVVEARALAERHEKAAQAQSESLAAAERAHNQALNEVTERAALARAQLGHAETLVAAKDKELEESRALLRSLAGTLEQVRHDMAARESAHATEVEKLQARIEQDRAMLESVRNKAEALALESHALKAELTDLKRADSREGANNERK